MQIRCLYDKLVPISELKPHPKNRNAHPQDQIERLAKILKYQGWRYPIKISKQSGFITSGHGRLAAAILNRWDSVPVNYQDYENTDQEYADLIADNSVASWAELELAKINLDLADLGPDFDLDMLGIKDFELEPADKHPGCDEDEVPENVEPKTKLGDIYKLGNHRLMCGDSTNIQHVDRLMGHETVGMTFTSPPYNAAKESHLNGRVGGFDNKYQTHADNLSDDDYADLLSGFTSIALEKTSFVFVNLQILTHNRIPLMEYQYAHRSLLKDVLVWNKKQCPPSIVKGAFNTKWEYVFCFSKDCKTRGFPVDWQGQYPNVVETESNSGNEFAADHKAGFPVAFPLWFLEKLDLGSVYDPFGGTGTTMIACEKTNRKCFMMELDPHYCDVIVARWEKYTGQKAELLSV